jgi:hypothetical protein
MIRSTPSTAEVCFRYPAVAVSDQEPRLRSVGGVWEALADGRVHIYPEVGPGCRCRRGFGVSPVSAADVGGVSPGFPPMWEDVCPVPAFAAGAGPVPMQMWQG